MPSTGESVGRLYTAIREAGFSVAGFARRMGVHRVSLYRYDRGLEAPVEPDFWRRAAQLLDVPEETINPKTPTQVAA